MLKMDKATYAKAREAALALKVQLEELIVGRGKPEYRCCCGTIRYGKAIAAETVPAGSEDGLHGQITEWYLWEVRMREEGGEERTYSLCLNDFLELPQIEAMFARAFADIELNIPRI